MAGEETHEISVVTYAAEKILSPVMHSGPVMSYAAWVEGLNAENPALAKFMGWGSFVHEGHVAVPDHVVGVTFVAALLMIGIPLLRRTLTIDRPAHGQQILELIVDGLRGMLDDVIGHDGRRYIGVIGTFAIFIFMGNFLGLVPGMTAPTSYLNVTLALGLMSFLYYNLHGFREQGVVDYLKHFMGPVIFMAPLMLVIEIFSHVFRPISLAIRLYGNMSGEHTLGGVFLGLMPLLAPVPVMALGLFVAFLQSYIFVMLSMVYIAGAVSHDEH